MKNIKVDLLVIGAGSGGLVLASGAAQLGANVVLGSERYFIFVWSNTLDWPRSTNLDSR